MAALQNFLLFASALVTSCNFAVICAQDCSTDNDPPVITCSNVTLINPFPNIFFGLVRNAPNGYTYDDVNEPGNAITYSLPISFTGFRYPPGYTEVVLLAIDLCGNTANCTFFVRNTVTELPVNCPDLNETVSLQTGQTTYTFQPYFGAGDVTLVDGVIYLYLGVAGVTVAHTADGVSIENSIELGPGTHEIDVIISDAVLNKSCPSFLTVEGTPTTVKFATTTTAPTSTTTPSSTSGVLSVSATVPDAGQKSDENHSADKDRIKERDDSSEEALDSDESREN